MRHTPHQNFIHTVEIGADGHFKLLLDGLATDSGDMYRMRLAARRGWETALHEDIQIDLLYLIAPIDARRSDVLIPLPAQIDPATVAFELAQIMTPQTREVCAAAERAATAICDVVTDFIAHGQRVDGYRADIVMDLLSGALEGPCHHLTAARVAARHV
jgi:hypothetical protein